MKLMKLKYGFQIKINRKLKMILIIIFIIIIFIKAFFYENVNWDKNVLKMKFYNYNHSFNNFTKITEDFIYFKISQFNYFYSFKYNLIKIEYKFTFHIKNNELISQSELNLYKNLQIICNIEILNSNIIINTISDIYQDKFFRCIEYFKINEKIKIGLIIVQKNDNEEKEKYYRVDFSGEILNNYRSNYFFINDSIFEQLIINKKYTTFVEKINDAKINQTLKLKKSYLRYPFCLLKREYIINENEWHFINIYNNYFCSCKGSKCLNINISQICKYFFYLYIIDNNRNVYQKSDYLFIDFILKEYSCDDAYPVFEEMSIQKLPVHYITEKLDIYQKYCSNKEKCLSIIYVNKNNYTMNGEFLEKYLKLFLKLKAVISGGGIYFNYITNIFYNIEYITYISIGHGISYFKYFLYANLEIYGSKIYDKILIPPSDILISVVKKYGWNNKDIIKINLPRWYKYNIDNKELYLSNNKTIIKNNPSIFLMFTWRETKRNKNISPFYFRNILNLLSNDRLKTEINKNKIILYFTLHHKLNNYKNLLKLNNYIHFIEESNISECLSRINLVISDFSSIIFDLIYRKRPFIIFIPDANDPQIENAYTKNYYELIQSIKNGTITMENKYFTINETINKIIYYINNNFNLDSGLQKLYDSFNLRNENSINHFIKYLKLIK